MHWKEREPVYRARDAPDPRAARLRAGLRGRDGRRAGRRRAAEPQARRRGARSPRRRIRRRSRGRSSTRWCATSGSRSERQPRRHRRAGAAARRAAAAPAPAAAARAPGRRRAARAPRGPARQAATARDGRGRRPRSRATASTGGRADGRARVGDDGPRPLALHDLRPRPLLGRDRRRVPGALFGAILVGLAVNGFTSPARTTPPASAPRGDPGRDRRHRRSSTSSACGAATSADVVRWRAGAASRARTRGRCGTGASALAHRV